MQPGTTKAYELELTKLRAERDRALVALRSVRQLLDYHFERCERHGLHPTCIVERGSSIDEEINRALGLRKA